MTYAHVSTYRLGDSAETYADVEHAAAAGDPVSDQSARTLGSWWHSPNDRSRNITALSHGLPFDTEELRAEVMTEVADANDANALLGWVDALEELLYPECEECSEPIDYCQGHGVIG